MRKGQDPGLIVSTSAGMLYTPQPDMVHRRMEEQYPKCHGGLNFAILAKKRNLHKWAAPVSS
jgi:hypothetical protein